MARSAASPVPRRSLPRHPAARLALVAAGAVAILRPADLGAQERLGFRRAAPREAYVKVWAGGGTLEVTGWDRDSVAVTGTREPGPGTFFHGASGDVVKLGFQLPDEERGAVRSDLRVRVPAAATVWVKVVSASVTVRGVAGPVDVSSGSGPVEVVGASGTVYLESMAGDLRVETSGPGSVVRLKGGQGDVTVRGRVEDLTATTVDGAVRVVDGYVHRAELESIDGPVEFRGGLARGGWLSAETHAGDIELVLPADVAAAFDLLSVRGEVEAHVPDPAGGAAGATGAGADRAGRSLSFETGSGAGEVTARSFSGRVTVRVELP